MIALLALRFVAELGMLVCLGIAGWGVGGSPAASIALALALPLLAAALWGRWIAPRAPRRLDDPGRLTLEVILFVGTLATAIWTNNSSPLTISALAVCAAFLVSLPARTHEPQGRSRALDEGLD